MGLRNLTVGFNAMFVFTASQRGIKPRSADKQTTPKWKASSRSCRFLWVNHFSCGVEESFQGRNYCMNGKSIVFFLRVYIAQKLSYKEKSLRLL